ncbi:hypothetical protein BATDEDRAFT_34603 [Batrachochytrium dendrobatidis JAM81]|uniref:Uncharacterized protein n=2 Tax=Batrachochytrium dendrobatidis TaxID=109871 RepID=F4NZ59_BATDJ|nr:uncharacterized protein BATDEDRAFT_34603 [Batrachochytrium dendrobatidis JAM81]EGF82143.1 hypothetical protein BATDEDRAFT_34603 [Batrachochytrium dendrobatidis JAM81]|eukprot:XP_006677422.1 hypothetical protein BATDEDRAFT_34603 [Batrachochytrium dendrobatidis JAM81]
MSLDSSICPVCEQHVKMVQLDQQMPEDVQKAFISIHSVIEDAVQTIRFQSENSLALIRALKQSNQFLTKKAIEYQHKYREIARQLSQATLEIQQMRQLLQKTRPPQSTYTSNPIAHRPATASSSKSPISSRLSLKPDSRSSGLNTIQPLAMNPNTFEAAAAEEKLAQQHKNRQQMTRQYYAAASTPHFQPSRVIQRPSTGVMRVTMPRPTSSRSTIEHTLEDQMNRKNRVLAPSKSMSSFSQLRFMKK